MEKKIPQTKEDLQNQLKDQLNFLQSSAESYDNGFKGEAKRMAHGIRILLYDTSNSYSLLGQLNLKKRLFYSTSAKAMKVGINQQRIGSYAGLIGIFLGTGADGYMPNLDNATPDGITGYVNFDVYWNEIIFIDKEKREYSRKDIVLSVANQDGGSHVDPDLNEKYAKLSRQNSLGWVTGTKERLFLPVTGAELAAIRQITHEVLHTLIPDYSYKKTTDGINGIIMGGQGIIITSKPFGKVGRIVLCPCGSGKKYKKCCGK